MINLIPNEEKKKMSSNFYLRLVTVIFVMLGVCFIIASVSILPAYLLSSMEKNFNDAKLVSQESELISLPDQNIITVVRDLKSKLSLIEKNEKNIFSFSKKTINEVVLNKTSNIKITRIYYQNDPQEGEKISINGVASSRETLISFRRALENDTAFSKVDLPISNFVKGSNIKFYLNLTPS